MSEQADKPLSNSKMKAMWDMFSFPILLIIAVLSISGLGFLAELASGEVENKDRVQHSACNVISKGANGNSKFVETSCGTFGINTNLLEQLEVGSSYNLLTTHGSENIKPWILTGKII